MDEKIVYHSYLLRLWQVFEGGKPVWRISLVDTQTRERCGFADLEALLAYLMDVVRGNQPGPRKPEHSG